MREPFSDELPGAVEAARRVAESARYAAKVNKNAVPRYQKAVARYLELKRRLEGEA